MRTTLTLEDDVAALLERVRKSKKLGLKEAINEALRNGFQQMLVPTQPTKVFKTKGVNLGRCLIGNIDDTAEALALGEGEHFR
jgi:hypothetical protein